MELVLNIAMPHSPLGKYNRAKPITVWFVMIWLLLLTHWFVTDAFLLDTTQYERTRRHLNTRLSARRRNSPQVQAKRKEYLQEVLKINEDDLDENLSLLRAKTETVDASIRWFESELGWNRTEIAKLAVSTSRNSVLQVSSKVRETKMRWIKESSNLTDTQVAKIIKRHPQILACSVDGGGKDSLRSSRKGHFG